MNSISDVRRQSLDLPRFGQPCVVEWLSVPNDALVHDSTGTNAAQTITGLVPALLNRPLTTLWLRAFHGLRIS
jgi:hypothetical protein